MYKLCNNFKKNFLFSLKNVNFVIIFTNILCISDFTMICCNKQRRK